ncbi:probable 4-coumarate--CoA ligase 3 [Manduca sexta]|uniref:Uncharacterized protein n=1 Tax=Manduca sexta TaxID=7130 RepID=A0A922CVK9_MANSE|nr:probable 4-coumarate--CoA ligase 3 [Manduca sexta]KAG6459996.1 hypothetical protein O3G_MSEX011710 [Manduca sexta]KAG6459997.1 hypothetical protein O3G_MSEX011710 [Manduca sexta]
MSSTLRRTALQILKKQKYSTAPSARRSNETNLLTSVFKALPVTNYTVNDFVWQNLDKWPDKTATVCAVTGHGYTYAQTHKMSVTFAASLRTKLKLKNDDKVAIILPNIPEYPCTILGVLQAGCIASMMNPVYTSHELKRQLEVIDCKAIVTSKISYANVKQAMNELKINIPVILVENEGLPEGTIKFAELAEDFNIDVDCLKSVHRSPKDVAILPFSSGTTGFPKAVVLTHESVVAMNNMIIDPEVVVIKETTATYQAVLPAILPFFHIFGFNALMVNQLTQGCKLVTMPFFKPDFFLETIVQHKADVLFIVPPMVVFLGKHPAVKPEHLASVSGIISGAAPLSATDAAAVLSKNKNIVFRQGYGLTETNGVISVGRNNDGNHAAVGHVMANCEVKIADLKTQEALGPGQEGEIWFRGPNVMSAYYKNEDATKEVLEGDWYKTGDIGKYDDKKYLYVTDRLKELIKVKGFQVPPAELETVLRTHPKILDCAVLGIPDPISGEVPKAFVVLQGGQEIDPMEILEFVNKQVAVFKNIKEVQFVDSIPKSPAGKILRKDLKQKYC